MSLGFYLSNGAVDVVGTIAVVMVFVQMTKPVIESAGRALSRNTAWDTTQVHDAVIELWTTLCSIAAVWYFTAVGPGFHTAADYGALVLKVVISVASEFGIYSKLRGPFPATPTAAYVARVTDRLALPRTVVSPPPPHPHLGSNLDERVTGIVAALEARVKVLETDMATLRTRLAERARGKKPPQA